MSAECDELKTHLLCDTSLVTTPDKLKLSLLNFILLQMLFQYQYDPPLSCLSVDIT